MSQLPANVFPYFDRVRQDPSWNPSKVALATLQSEGAIQAFNDYRKSARLVQAFNIRLAQWLRSKPKTPRSTGTRQIGRRLSQFVRFMVPVLPDLVRRRAIKIYQRFVEEPTLLPHDLSRSDLDFLKRWQLDRDLNRFRQDLDHYRNGFLQISRIRRRGTVALWSIAVPAIALALWPDDNALSEMSKYDDQVELLLFTPSATAGIRMGGNIYHFDRGHRARLRIEDLGASLASGLATSKAFYRVGIELTDTQKDALRDRLEADVNSFYLYDLFDVNAVSEANKQIAAVGGPDILPVADRSTALTLASYRLLHFMRDSRTRGIQFESTDNPLNRHHTDTPGLSEIVSHSLDTGVFLMIGKRLVILGPILDLFPMTIR